VYEYLLPSYALLPPRPGTPMSQHTKPASSQTYGAGPDWAYWDGADAETTAAMRGWRIGDAQLTSLRESAKIYEGE
jgi:hypothetical protein